ncbi:MAG: HAD family hydrolase [Rhodospirillales bacterium]
MIINILSFDAVVFDLDGTLIDSLPDMALALNKLLVDEGRRKLKMSEIRGLIGKGAPKMIESAFNLTGASVSVEGLARAHLMYTQHYSQYPSKESKVYDGVLSTLQQLKQEKIKMGVCSNKAVQMVKLIISAFELENYFCGVTGGDNVRYKKPDGRHILTTLNQMNISSKNVLMIGDTVNDVEAAKNLGLPSVSVSYGYGKPEEIASSDCIVNDLRELLF